MLCSWTYPKSYRDIILLTSEKYELDPLLIGAIVFTESRYNDQAISSAGALGLMQLMPSTASELALKKGLLNLTEKDYLERGLNIELGCHYLSNLKKSSPNEPLWVVLASYNAGASTVRSWLKGTPSENLSLEMIRYPETRKYVRQVTWIYKLLGFYQFLGMV